MGIPSRHLQGNKEIAERDHDKLRVELIAASTGKLPKTGGSGMPVHDRIREEMRTLLDEADTPEWRDEKACEMLAEARRHYAALRLAETAAGRDAGVRRCAKSS